MAKNKLNKNWLHDHINDPYVKLAQKEGYRARAAYKLKEIDESEKLIKPGQIIVDLGSTPGSWSQYVRQKLAGAENGGINGTIAGADAILADATDQTIIIPGHGQPVSNRRELQSYRDMLVSVRDNVAKLKADGRSIDEIVAASPSRPFDAKWGQFVISPAFFTKLVYQGV